MRSTHPPTLVLELHSRGEPPLAAGLWDEHLASCLECAATLRGMAAEDDAYRRDPRALDLAARLSSLGRRRVPTLRRYRWVAAIVPLAAAAAFLLWPRRVEHDAGLSAKGGGLEVAVEREGRATPWDGRPLGDGDLLQLSLSTSRGVQIAVLGREGGEVIQLYPEHGSTSVALPPGAHTALGGSLRVEGSALRLYLFESPTVFDIEPLRAALLAGAIPSFTGKTQVIDLPGTRSP